MTEYVLDAAKGATIDKALPDLLPKLVKADSIRLMGDHSKVPFRIDFASPGVTLIGGGGATLGQFSYGPKARGWRNAWLRFRGLDPNPSADDISRLVDVAPGAEQIDFLNCNFATTDDVSKWTPTDWTTRPFNTALLHRGTKSYVKNSQFFNVRNAVSLSANDMIADGLNIRDFGNDAIQFGGSRLLITRCLITKGRHTTSEKLHADAMQGYPKPDGTAHEDVTISDNVVDMTGASGDYLQGLSAFDGRWKNVKVLRNNVTCDAYHGITWFGVDGIVIEDNHVLGSKTTKPWIGVWAGKDGRPSSGVSEARNVASGGIKIQPTVKGP